jgi:protein-ribulosamine 3-kinase
MAQIRACESGGRSEGIPQLLGNLRDHDGSDIKPHLVHGDLYDGNVDVNNRTGRVLLFDEGSYCAHNEMELGYWRLAFNRVFPGQGLREALPEVLSRFFAG